MSEIVYLGHEKGTGSDISLRNEERCSGLYVLGKPGMGKSTLLFNMAKQDIENGNKIFFLDPHGETIDLVIRSEGSPDLKPILLDVSDNEYSFGINLLECPDTSNLNLLTDTYTRAYNVFFKLWEENWGVWLQLILQNVLWALIEHGEYTLAEVPLFLNPQQSAFRKEILSKIKLNTACRDFWESEFFQRRERDQQERVDAALTRINTLLTHPYVRHIIGQKKTTTYFPRIFSSTDQLGIFIKLAANLAEDIKKFVGIILISELLHAVRNRPEDKRDQLCIFVDEFQNFASSDDMRTLITEGRKFGSAITFAHQERFGQFADNQKLMGATLAAANKVFFQLTVKDAQELAPEFAQEPTETRTRLGGQLINSPYVMDDVWEKGHPDKLMMTARLKYYWIVDLLKKRPEENHYIFDPQTIQKTELHTGNLHHHYESFNDWLGYRATPEMLRRGISLLNKFYYDCMQNKYREALTTRNELDLFLEIIDCFSGIFGWRQTMEAHIPQHMRERFIQKMQAKQDNEIMDLQRRMEAGLLPRATLYLSPDYYNAFYGPGMAKKLEVQAFIKKNQPELLKEWIIHEVPNYYLTDEDISWWQYLGREVFHPNEMEEFIVWSRREEPSKERLILRELVWVVSDVDTDKARYEANWQRLTRQYVAIMAYAPMALKFGMDYQKLPEEQTDPYLRLVSGRIGWQTNEFQQFIVSCLRYLPWYLGQYPIKTQSAQYDEGPKREKTQGEMVDIMAQELMNLPRFTAYAKLTQERLIKQGVFIHKLATDSPMKVDRNDLMVATNNGHKLSKKRTDIEAEIRERQEKWRRIQTPTTSEPPPTPKPPPTSD